MSAIGHQRSEESKTSKPTPAPPPSDSALFLRLPLKPRFGQINITLDSAQDLVVDRLFVAQCDHGVALCLQHLAGQFLKVRRKQSADDFFMRGFTAQLPDTVCVF